MKTLWLIIATIGYCVEEAWQDFRDEVYSEYVHRRQRVRDRRRSR